MLILDYFVTHKELKHMEKSDWDFEKVFPKKLRLIDWVGFNVPLNTVYGISGTDFYGSNNPTNSVKALKEVIVLGQASIPPGPPHHVTVLHMHVIIHIQKWI